MRAPKLRRQRLVQIALVSLVGAGASLSLPERANTAFAQSADDKALKELEGFLFDTAARKAFASQTGGAAASAETDLSRYPPEIQRELLAIVMLIMRESRENALRHADAMKAGGPEAAMRSFSPAVRARIAAVARKLAAAGKVPAR